MKKEIKDYLHLYIGCEAIDSEYPEEGKFEINTGSLAAYEANLYEKESYPKLFLRPLSDMTELEKHLECQINIQIKGVTYHERHAKVTAFLLKQGFDLFGLIKAGLAIDKTTLKP